MESLTANNSATRLLPAIRVLVISVPRGRSIALPEDSEDSERDEGAAEILVVGDAEPDVVRHDGDEVDEAHDAARVLAARRRRVQPQQVPVWYIRYQPCTPGTSLKPDLQNILRQTYDPPNDNDKVRIDLLRTSNSQNML